MIGLAVLVVGASAAALLAAGRVWSPAQRMPSAIALEPGTVPPGSDASFTVTSTGGDGPDLIRHAVFAVADSVGRPVAAASRLVTDGAEGTATLLVSVDDGGRVQLCAGAATHPDWPVKLAVRELITGVEVQAVLPAGWCPR